MFFSHLSAPPASAGPVKALASVLLLSFAILCCASTARAIPITITGGVARTPQGLGNFSVGLTAPDFSFSGFNAAAPRQQLCGLCAPGGSFPTVIMVTGLSTQLSLTYNGVTYGSGNGVVSFNNFVITLPPFTIPTDLSPVFSPFTFSGTASAAPAGGGAPLIFELTGAGTVTFTFIPNASGGSTLGAAVFSFAPPAAVPEPATMILLATGLAGVAARVRKRRKG